MRHRKKKITLDRKTGPRKALIRGLVSNLIIYENINTTIARAKALKPIVEKLITIGKNNNLTNRRKLLENVYTSKAAKKILEVLSVRYKDRKGGYTKIINLGPRKGDGAKIVKIKFV